MWCELLTLPMRRGCGKVRKGKKLTIHTCNTYRFRNLCVCVLSLDVSPSLFIARISSEVELAALYFKLTDVLAATTSHPNSSIFCGSFCCCVISRVRTDGRVLSSSISPHTEFAELPRPTHAHTGMQNKLNNHPGSAFFPAHYFPRTFHSHSPISPVFYLISVGPYILIPLCSHGTICFQSPIFLAPYFSGDLIFLVQYYMSVGPCVLWALCLKGPIFPVPYCIPLGPYILIILCSQGVIFPVCFYMSLGPYCMVKNPKSPTIPEPLGLIPIDNKHALAMLCHISLSEPCLVCTCKSKMCLFHVSLPWNCIEISGVIQNVKIISFTR